MENTTPMFASLNESTIHGWFEPDGQTLKPHPQLVITAMKTGNLLRLSFIHGKTAFGMAMTNLNHNL